MRVVSLVGETSPEMFRQWLNQAVFRCELPSSAIIIKLIENYEYMVRMKEKLLEIKQVYRNLKFSSLAGRR